MVLRHEGFEVETFADGVARVRDVELGERLGYAEPRMLRKLIKRWAANLGEVSMRSTVERIEKTGAIRGIESREVSEFWLTEEQALFVTVKSDATEAIKITKQLLAAFVAMRDAIEDIAARESPIFDRLVNALLLPKPTEEWERMFQPSLIKALCGVYRKPWIGGRHPRFLGQINRMIYDAVFSSPMGAEIKARNPNPQHHSNHSQLLTPEAKEYFRVQLGVIEAIARGSRDKADFWKRMDREYAGGMLQLTMGAQS